MNDITQLVKMAVNGDKAAFESLYEQTKSGVWFTCLSLLKNEENAKDIMQDTYLAAFDKLNTLENHAAFKTWLNKIAANKCKNFLIAKANSAVESNSEEILEKIPDDKFLPEEYVTDAEKRRIIMDIIEDVLSANQYRTIILYYFDEMSVAEIAELMECHEKTVQYRLKTARLKIKEEITRYEKESRDKLHAVVPFVLLTQLFRAQAESVSVPAMPVPNVSSAPSNALNVPSDQAAAAVKTGGKTMLNSLKAKIIAGACAAAVVGGGVTAGVLISNNSKNKTESRPAVSAPANVSKPTNVSKPANNSKPADSSATESTADVRIDEWYDKPFATPDGWKKEHVALSRLWSGQMSTDTPIYYMAIADMVYQYDNPETHLTVQDVPEVFAKDTQDVVMEKFDCYRSKYRIAAADTQEITVQGYPFLKETGTIHTEMEEVSAELSYIAYYGLMDFPTFEHTGVPVVWMVFAEGNDPAVLADMQKILDDTAANIN